MKPLLEMVLICATLVFSPLFVGATPYQLIMHLETANSNVQMGVNLPVSIIISNAGTERVVIDTTPDEMILPKTETCGGAWRQKGSRYWATIHQTNTIYRGFITLDCKIEAPSKSPSIPLESGQACSQTVEMPTDSEVYIQSGPLIPGPAQVSVTLRLAFIGTNQVSVVSSPLNVTLERNDKSIFHNQSPEVIHPKAGDKPQR